MKSNDTHINLLCSYAYCGKNQKLNDMIIGWSRNNKANIMIDSGAFTKVNATSDFSHVNVDDYCKYLEKFGEEFQKYVMLDVPFHEKESKENYEQMIKRGLKPMFVATMFDRDFSYIKDTLKICPHICVAGGVTTKGDWMTKRFQEVYRNTDCKARIHGLGYVTFPKMLQLNLESVDSSSWSVGALKFGTLSYFDRGLKHIDMADIRKAGGLKNERVIELLERIKVTPKMLADPKNHRGKLSIQRLASALAYMQMQRYCYKRGLRLFLAINPTDMYALDYIINNYNDLSYEEYKSYENKNCRFFSG